jgi:hypothetical protein
MRWRQSFMVEVAQSLQLLGLRTCPVCGLADSLCASHLPVLLVDGGFPSCIDDHSPAEERDGDLTFALRIECTACGYLMLFNAERFRTADDKIIVPEGLEAGGQLEE